MNIDDFIPGSLFTLTTWKPFFSSLIGARVYYEDNVLDDVNIDEEGFIPIRKPFPQRTNVLLLNIIENEIAGSNDTWKTWYIQILWGECAGWIHVYDEVLAETLVKIEL
jgi:hypothetical protein